MFSWGQMENGFCENIVVHRDVAPLGIITSLTPLVCFWWYRDNIPRFRMARLLDACLSGIISTIFSSYPLSVLGFLDVFFMYQLVWLVSLLPVPMIMFRSFATSITLTEAYLIPFRVFVTCLSTFATFAISDSSIYTIAICFGIPAFLTLVGLIVYYKTQLNRHLVMSVTISIIGAVAWMLSEPNCVNRHIVESQEWKVYGFFWGRAIFHVGCDWTACQLIVSHWFVESFFEY